MLGALVGLIGSMLLFGGGSEPALFVVGLLGIVGLAFDLGLFGLRLPSIKRQVDDAWLYEYRGWLYGLGFGIQLGAGVFTIVASSAVYIAFLAAMLTASWQWALIVGTFFGLARAATQLPAAWGVSPKAIIRIDASLARTDRVSRNYIALAQAVLGLCAIGIAI